MSRLAVLGALACATFIACHEHKPLDLGHTKSTPVVASVEPRQGLLPTFPCTRCHDKLPTNPKERRLVEFHTQRNDELHHGDSAGWCYHCHSEVNINRLLVGSGDLVTFNESYLLCGSCHGDKLRDWNITVHGKTMGSWRGDKVRRTCTGCHNPHRPAFGKLQPEDPPIPPQQAGQK